MRLRADTGACSWAMLPRVRLPRPAAARRLGFPCFDPALPRATRTAPMLTRPAPARNRQRSLGRGHVTQSRDAAGTSAFRRPRVPPLRARLRVLAAADWPRLSGLHPLSTCCFAQCGWLPRVKSKWWETFQALYQSFAQSGLLEIEFIEGI